MDDGSGSSIWQRLTRVFHGSHVDSVEQAIREASQDGELDKEEGSMLLSVLSLDDMKVQDIMTPRTDIVSIPDTATMTEIAELIIETGHSRLPVYQDDRDNIVGVIHAKDLLGLVLAKENFRTDPKNIAASFMREPFFVPETKNVLGLLQEFRARKQHLAIILDEYGGTAGIISIEDVFEQIVGDIEDEHDAPREEEICRQGDGCYLLAGRTLLEDLAEELSFPIESEEVDTIGGYLSLLTGRVPRAGEEFLINGARFTVMEADAKQIHRLKMELLAGENAPPVTL